MRFAALAAALLPATALATISITGPSDTAYWVEFTSNNISWSFTEGDPNPVSIIVTNSNETFLNGEFSIAEFVDLSPKSFTVTNVTLKVADGFQVSFVNPTNHSQVYATSNTFSVKAPGTTPAPQPSSPSSSASSSGASPSATSPSSTDSNGTTTSGASNHNGATGSSVGLLSMTAAAGIAAVSALLL